MPCIVDGDLLIVLGGVLCMEGVMPMLTPALWRRIISNVLQSPEQQLRWIGGTFAVFGCVLLLVATPVPLAVAGGLFLVEGLPLLLMPQAWIGVMRNALALRDGQLRFLGVLGFGIGSLILLWSWMV